VPTPARTKKKAAQGRTAQGSALATKTHTAKRQRGIILPGFTRGSNKRQKGCLVHRPKEVAGEGSLAWVQAEIRK
jgi:hypothetical protein